MRPTTRLSQHIAQIHESATLKVDARAKALQREGRDVVSYAAGEPDFATPAHIVDAAVMAARDPASHRYSAAAGLPELREAIAAKTLRDSGIRPRVEDIVVTNGGKQAAYQSFQVLLDPGDEVLVPTPYWTSYPEMIALAGGTQVSVFAGADQGYRVTVAQLEAARTPRTKALLFVSPNNPTGAVYDADEVRAIGEWALEHGLWVLSDEIYQNLVYSEDATARPDRAVSLVEAVPELADQAILINGMAKSFAMTGWRVGWMLGPADVIKGALNLQSHLCSNVANITQRAALAGLTGPQDCVEEMRQAFDRRRRMFVTELSRVRGFQVPVPMGAFYLYPDVRELLGTEVAGKRVNTSAELAEIILDQVLVAVVPGEAFGSAGHLRLSYALSDEAIMSGARRLQELFGTK